LKKLPIEDASGLSHTAQHYNKKMREMKNAALQVEEEKLQDPGLPSVPLNITTTTQPSRLPESLRSSQESTPS
jgi:hypothetical protein